MKTYKVDIGTYESGKQIKINSSSLKEAILKAKTYIDKNKKQISQDCNIPEDSVEIIQVYSKNNSGKFDIIWDYMNGSWLE